ncbi:uncharacterized protein LOC135959675 [Calliphora vicina]|uniref:uncharacterized protein LOC135959675 n=1 Tax=Calliphora vicina TaxID=7373 RepID=UPI00325BF476
MYNMQVLFSLILIFCTISSGLAAAYYGYFGNSDNPGKCLINGLILLPGEVHYEVTQCAKVSCGEDGMAYFVSCGVYKPPGDCVLGDPIDPTGRYPDCCARRHICNTILGDEY